MVQSLGMLAHRDRRQAPDVVQSGVLGTLLGLLLALALRESGSYALGCVLVLGLLVALGRSGLAPFYVQRASLGDERLGRLPYLEQAIGMLVALLWLEPPSLLTLAVGFFVYRFLDVYPLSIVRGLRQAGTRDRVLMGQWLTGLMALGCLLLLRALVMPGYWSMA